MVQLFVKHGQSPLTMADDVLKSVMLTPQDSASYPNPHEFTPSPINHPGPFLLYDVRHQAPQFHRHTQGAAASETTPARESHIL